METGRRVQGVTGVSRNTPLLFLPYYIPILYYILAPIGGNIPYYKELSLYNRGVVIGYGLAEVTAP